VYIAQAAFCFYRMRGRSLRKTLGLASSAQVVWASIFAAQLTELAFPTGTLTIAEGLRSLAWLAFVLYLPISIALDPTNNHAVRRFQRIGLTLAFAFVLASIASDFLLLGGRWQFGWKVIIALFGLVCIEQLYRNTSAEARWQMKFLVFALLGLFGFDLVMYSDALLFNRLDPNWWIARGFINALLMPLFVIAMARSSHLRLEMAVSHRMAFHTASLVMGGGYLIFISLIGYYLRAVGGSLGAVVQAVFGFAAILGLAVLFFSSNTRARFRVFVAKNFFAYRYDYREEWLKFTDSMSRADENGLDSVAIANRSVEALSRLLETKAGAIWILDANQTYQRAGSIGIVDKYPVKIASSEPHIRFLAERDWVIGVSELLEKPAIYDNLTVPTWWIDAQIIAIAPLSLHGRLYGIVALGAARTEISLNWEVRDLIKTLGRQTASYLAQQEATAKLIEMQQFDSFNKLSAFVVHDLKNLVAQLSLMMANAQRHRDNPEFQADMLATVENVLGRMHGLLLQLRSGTKPAEPALSLDLHSLINEAIDSKKTEHATKVLDLSLPKGTQVLGHTDRLVRVLGHLIQNADEACSKMPKNEGKIIIGAQFESQRVKITVSDNGCGMTSQFLQTKLFRPFNTTKGMGMGIGAYESREYLREIGGTISVTSVVGQGSCFTVDIPAFAALN
jgi:putative PEP-CTERM system histidine kinase